MKRYAAYDPPEYQNWTADPALVQACRECITANPEREAVIRGLTREQQLLGLYAGLLRNRLHDVMLKRWVKSGVISKAWLGVGEEATHHRPRARAAAQRAGPRRGGAHDPQLGRLPRDGHAGGRHLPQLPGHGRRPVHGPRPARGRAGARRAAAHQPRGRRGAGDRGDRALASSSAARTAWGSPGRATDRPRRPRSTRGSTSPRCRSCR